MDKGLIQKDAAASDPSGSRSFLPPSPTSDQVSVPGSLAAVGDGGEELRNCGLEWRCTDQLVRGCTMPSRKQWWLRLAWWWKKWSEASRDVVERQNQ